MEALHLRFRIYSQLVPSPKAQRCEGPDAIAGFAEDQPAFDAITPPHPGTDTPIYPLIHDVLGDPQAWALPKSQGAIVSFNTLRIK